MTSAIKFEDIKAGDTISRTDMGITLTGTAHHLLNGWWLTENDGVIATAYFNNMVLADRPAPPEPTNIGAVVSASLYNDPAQEFVRKDRGDEDDTYVWVDRHGDLSEWRDLKDPTVLHEGWNPDAA